RVDLNFPETSSADGFKFDIFSERASQKVRDRNNKLVDVDDTRIEWLSARKGKQSLGQLRGTLRTYERIVEGPFSPRLNDAPFGNTEITYDDREKIVEVVRDTSGQLTDGFHLLRLTECLLRQIASFRLRVQGTRAAHREQNKREEHERGGDSENEMTGHCPHPVKHNRVSLNSIGNVQVRVSEFEICKTSFNIIYGI